MPGTLTVKPLQANFTRDKDFLLNKMDPYCEVILGGQKTKTHVCAHGGKHPYWGDVFTLQSNNEPMLYVNIKDRDRFSHDDNIGTVQVDLRNVTTIPKGAQWYPVTGKHGSEGELLLDISYNPGHGMQQMHNQQVPMQTGFTGQMQTAMPMIQQPTMQPTVQQTVQPMMGQPTMGYQQAQPMMQQAQHMMQQAQPMMQQVQPMMQQAQPMMQQAQPMMTQAVHPGIQPTMGVAYTQPPVGVAYVKPQPTAGIAYTQPVGTVMPGVQPQVYPNQGYAQTNMGANYY